MSDKKETPAKIALFSAEQAIANAKAAMERGAK